MQPESVIKVKILIRFHGDNDFATVMKGFGDILANDNRSWNRLVLTHENIARWFNSIAPTLYMMLQNKGTYDSDTETSGYLTIEPKDVFINEEVDVKMETWANQWGNGDSVLINLDPAEFPFKPIVTIV